MTFIADTDLVGDIRPAVNFSDRPAGEKIDMLVLHYTGMQSGKAALDWLVCEESRVSCHYLVFEDGLTVQMVPESVKAWHAGISNWRGRSNCNTFSVGIEIVNPGHEFGYRAFPDAQIRATSRLARDIVQRNSIQARNVVGHSDIAPDRKQDPGELFPWEDLHREGIGHFVAAEPVGSGRFFQAGDAGAPISALQILLATYGYGLAETGNYDSETETVVTAFQRHFRPQRVDGIADQSTIATLHKLLKSLPDQGTI